MDIDFVYTYVNNLDEVWQNKYKKHSYCQTNQKRFDFQGEIFFSLRTAEKYANFARNIFIVSDNQPFDLSFLSEDFRKKIIFVDHKEIIPSEFLPTFNSCAIEIFLWKIPGLSSSFVYLNDDVFFGNYVTKDFFFDDGLIIFGERYEHDPFFEKDHEIMYRKTHHLFQSRFNTDYWLTNSHTCFQMNTETCMAVFEEFNEHLMRTAAIKERKYDAHNTNFENCQSFSFLTLNNLMLYKNGLGKPNKRGAFIKELDKESLSYLFRVRPRTFCVNSLNIEEWNKLRRGYLNEVLYL